MSSRKPIIDFKAADMGAELVAFGKRIRNPGVTAVSVVADVTSVCIPGTQGPFLDSVARNAAAAVARLIDGDPKFGKPAYHNVAHYLEVGVTAFAMGLKEHEKPDALLREQHMQLSVNDVGDIFIAGFIHDLGHPGGNNKKQAELQGAASDAFLLEKQSWELAKPLLKAAGYNGYRLERLRTMVLATDPGHGVPVLERVMEHQTMRKEMPSAGLIDNDDLKGLNNLKTAAMSYILTKSDVASSLMPESNLDRTTDLHNEHAASQTGMKLLDDAGKVIKAGALFFLEKIAGADKPFFLASVQRVLGGSARATLALTRKSVPAETAPALAEAQPERVSRVFASTRRMFTPQS